MQTLVFGLLLCLVKGQLQPISCDGDACWRPPIAVLPESEQTTEEEAVVALSCYLACANSTAEEEDCQSGCTIQHSNPTLSLQDCTDMCGGTMSCEDGCRITVESPVMQLPPPPTSPPLVSSTVQEGVYTVSISRPSNSDSVSSNDDQVEEVYLVQVVDQLGNEAYFTMLSFSKDISLLNFACSEVSISYAIVTVDSVSEYSPPQNICVFLPPGGPDAAQELSVEFEEDLREEFLQHAILTLYWESPSNNLRLEEYQLVIEYTPPFDGDNDDNNCRNQSTLTLTLDRELTNYTVAAGDTSLQTLPLYECYYRATLVSLPGSKNVSIEFPLKYTSDDRENIELVCPDPVFDPESVMYNISAMWNITNLLLSEGVGFYILNLDRVTFGLPDPSFFQTFTLEPEVNQLEYEHVFFTHPAEIDLTLIVMVRSRRNRNFFWRRPLLPSSEHCIVVTPPPPPPTPVLSDSITVENIVFIPEAGRLEFSVSWKPPAYLNGKLSYYELCLGEEAVNGLENCTAPSTNLCIAAPEVETTDRQCTPLELGSTGLPFKNIETNCSMITLQIRAQNMFGFFGNWSEAIHVSCSGELPSSDEVPSSDDQPSSDELEGWAYGVIVAALLLLVASLVAVVLIFVCCYYFRKKFKSSLWKS